MNKLNITFCSFPDYSGNARALYEYMNKKYKDKMNLSWVIKDDELYKKLKAKSVNVVKDETDEMKNLMKKTNVFFTTHANLTEYKVQNSDSLYIELWHGVSPKCVGYLINNMSESDALWMKNINKKIDYFIVPSKFWVPIFSARFNILPERILPLGFPLFDNIVNSNGKNNLSKVLNTDISKYKKIIYYMPTARSGASRDENVTVNKINVFNIKKYSDKALLEFLEKNNYLLCVKYHPSEKISFNRVESEYIKYIDENKMKKYKFDTNMLLNAADALITDYSSLGLHYLMLEKPVIYLKNDLKDFNDTRGILFGNFDFWADDNVAANFDSLITKIDENLNYPNIERIKQKKNLLFGSLKNGGCKEICNCIFNNDGQLNNDLKAQKNYEEQLKLENQKTKEELRIVNDELIAIKNGRLYKIVSKLKKYMK